MTKRETVTVERDKTKVTIEIDCKDIYAAILLYDGVVQSLKDGRLVLSVAAKGRETA